MATVAITFATLIAPDVSVESAYPRASENITSSASSQATTATARNGEVIAITAAGGDIRAAFGADPTATSTGILILDGQTRFFQPEPGHKAAVIDA
jgi:hypothetical protein